MIWIADFDATPENIDNIICAEIPRDPSASKREEDFTKEDKKAQRYHDTVKKCMMHGPCGDKFGRGHYGCRKEGKCIKNFPKKLQPTTEIGNDSFPEYCRRSKQDG